MNVVPLPGEGSVLVLPELTAEDLRDLIAEHDRNVERGETLKHDSKAAVTRVEVRERAWAQALGVTAVVVKRTRYPWRWRLGYGLGGVTSFAYDFEGYDRLRQLGVASPRVLAASLRPRGGTETLVTGALAGGCTLREWLWLGPHALDDGARRRRLLADVGEWLRRVHDAGVWHRDLKPNNIFVRLGDVTELVLLDTTDLRITPRGLDERRRVRNIAQVVDLPRGLDAEAEAVLIPAYCAHDEREADDLLARVRRAVATRRARRRRSCGFEYVDEEHFGRRGG